MRGTKGSRRGNAVLAILMLILVLVIASLLIEGCKRFNSPLLNGNYRDSFGRP